MVGLTPVKNFCVLTYLVVGNVFKVVSGFVLSKLGSPRHVLDGLQQQHEVVVLVLGQGEAELLHGD